MLIQSVYVLGAMQPLSQPSHVLRRQEGSNDEADITLTTIFLS